MPTNLSTNNINVTVTLAGAVKITQLTDVPSYTGSALKFLRVNEAGNAIEFVESSASVAWGDITGTLANQADLQTALDAKADSSSVPTLLSDLGGDLDDIENGDTYVKSENNYTDAEKTKLTGIEVGAEVNNISDANATDLTDGGQSNLHYHDSDRARANHTGVQAGETVELKELGTATYDDIQDFINSIQSAGVISGGIISDGGSGTINISAVKGIVKTTNSEIGEGRFFDLDAVSGQALTDNDINYVSVDYNSGTPQFIVGITDTSNGRTIFNLGRVYKQGTELDIINSGLRIYDFSNRVQLHHLEDASLHFVSGAIVSETGTRNLDVTSGVLYSGINRIITDAIDTSGADIFEAYYYNGTSWVEADLSQIDNANYNDTSSGLVALTPNRYGVHWVYKGTGSKLYVIYGQGDYTLSEAQGSQPPTTLPDHVAEMGVLRAKIIIKASDTSFTEIESVTNVNLQSITVANHSELAGLQGGQADQYYHLNLADYTLVDNAGTANGVATLDSGGKVPTSQLPSSLMEYKGVWDASTNSPSLADGTGDNGDVYRVTVSGSQDLGSGSISFEVGDYVIYNGSVWEKSDTTDAVASVFGRTGIISAQNNDYTWAQIDKTTSDLADLTTKSHTDLDDIGTNTHAQIDTHIANTSNPHSVSASDVGAITELSDDTTPQLGGDLDMNEKNIDIDAIPSTDNTALGDVTDDHVAGESLVFGDVVYLKSDGKWWKATNTAIATTGLTAMALESKSADQAVKVLLRGFVRDDDYAFTVGGTVYLGASGAVTQTAPSTEDYVIQVLGYATHADRFYFNPSVDRIEYTA